MCGRIHTVSFLSYSGILCIGRFWHFLFVLLAFGPIIGLEKVLHDVTSNILKVRSPGNDASEGAKGEELGFELGIGLLDSHCEFRSNGSDKSDVIFAVSHLDQEVNVIPINSDVVDMDIKFLRNILDEYLKPLIAGLKHTF